MGMLHMFLFNISYRLLDGRKFLFNNLKHSLSIFGGGRSVIFTVFGNGHGGFNAQSAGVIEYTDCFSAEG